MARIRQELACRHVHPTHAVVLLPYAQLIQVAKAAWARDQPSAQFVPRFETTMNWTRLLGGYEPADDDLRLDAARDVLTAAGLLARAGFGGQQTMLTPRLMEAAQSLAKVAAAVPPDQRLAWGVQLGDELDSGMATPLLALERAIARIALAWAASSSYATDRLFAAQPGLLVVIEGFQAEPLVSALMQQLTARGDRALSLSLHAGTASAVSSDMNLALHPTQDAEDEAQTAAACVLAHINQGRSPVALVAVDRVLIRRVRAMLADRGVAVRDETGWKVSTTRAAATLMSLLRASVWNASSDAVLDWLKNAPAFDVPTVTALEMALRKAGTRDWRGAVHLSLDATLVSDVNALFECLRPSRTVSAWLVDLRNALQTSGQWPGLVGDVAGQAVLKALRLDVTLDATVDDEFAPFTTPLSLSEFTVWVSQTCEADSFYPVHPAQAQVVILPLSQLLGRALPAVVLPGCDEVRLSPSNDPPGLWTPAQREQLGLPSREALALALRQSWHYALQAPHLDLLWRTSEGGERLMPSGFVQALLLSNNVHPTPGGATVTPDPRALRTLLPQPSQMPSPRGDDLPVARLSSSAYEDLRRCPYRFFALRQLRLQESDELESELSKRDFGNWLHSLLKHFHLALQQVQASKDTQVPVFIDKLAMINVASTQATEELGLSPSEFLPFAAAWPKVRAGYLQWLDDHEATGAKFLEAEVWKEMPLGAITLIGKLDRVDLQADGTPLVLDYKTEARTLTAERLKPATQDTQIAFYGALISDDTLGAAYINLGEKEPSKTYSQPDIVHLRDQLIEGILSDTSRIAEGVGLRAMGEGKSCDFCAARGLCRKDFWSVK